MEGLPRPSSEEIEPRSFFEGIGGRYAHEVASRYGAWGYKGMTRFEIVGQGGPSVQDHSLEIGAVARGIDPTLNIFLGKGAKKGRLEDSRSIVYSTLLQPVASAYNPCPVSRTCRQFGRGIVSQ